MLGGTQSLHCNGRDEAFALPTEEAAGLALRTQQIIAAESGVANTVDPVAGSFAIESLTNQIEQKAEELLDRVDRLGGTLTAIESGWIQREIQESAYRAQVAIESGETVVVGVNRLGVSGPGGPQEPPAISLFRVDADVERQQIDRVRTLRSSRSAADWQAAIDAVSLAAREGENLVPPIIAAIESKATVGEISDTMRTVFGEYQETNTW